MLGYFFYGAQNKVLQRTLKHLSEYSPGEREFVV